MSLNGPPTWSKSNFAPLDKYSAYWKHNDNNFQDWRDDCNAHRSFNKNLRAIKITLSFDKDDSFKSNRLINGPRESIVCLPLMCPDLDFGLYAISELSSCIPALLCIEIRGYPVFPSHQNPILDLKRFNLTGGLHNKSSHEVWVS